MGTTWVLISTATQLFTIATLIANVFLQTMIARIDDAPGNNINTKTYVQMNWFCIGAASVASMVNIMAIHSEQGVMMGVAALISVITVVMTGLSLYHLGKATDAE